MGVYLAAEGSSYGVERNTLKSAIYAYDGRGSKTVIWDILMEDWKLKKLWDIVGIGFSVSERQPLVASAAKIADTAARECTRYSARMLKSSIRM